MIWQRTKTMRGGGVYADVDGVGRYLIRWIVGDQEWRAYLNGKRTTYAAKTVGDVQKMVERVDAALDQFEREQAVTLVVEDPDGALPPPDGSGRGPPKDMEEFSEEVYKQAQHYAPEKKHIVLTDIYLAIEGCARKCVELERRVKELEDRYERDDHRS